MMKMLNLSPARSWFIYAGSFFVGIVIVTIASGSANAFEPEPKRQQELIHQLIQDCGSCHGLLLKGGLGPALLPADLKGKDIEDLVHVILEGVPGTPMPPWAFEITKDEAQWLVESMKEGGINEH